MSESVSAGGRFTVEALKAGREKNLDLALAMEADSSGRNDRSDDIGQVLPEHLRSAADRLNQLIDYLENM